MGTVPTGATNITSLVGKFYAKRAQWGEVYIKGAWNDKAAFYLTGTGTTFTATWTGTWTKAEVDAMQIKMVGDSNGLDWILLDRMYVIATYTPPPFAGVINGITPTHINGIAVGDLIYWNGLS